jgi:hypothetical protein
VVGDDCPEIAGEEGGADLEAGVHVRIMPAAIDLSKTLLRTD